MKKITSLLTLLLLMMSGVMFAQETTVPTEVTDLSQISNNKTYTLVSPNRFIGVKEQKAIFGYNGTPEPTNKDNLFAIIKKDEKFFLFNVGQEKFVNVETTSAGGQTTMSLKESVDFGFTINSTENENYPWCFRVPEKNNWLMNMGGSNQMIVDAWSQLDNGNQYKISEIGNLAEETLNKALNLLTPDYAQKINNTYDETKLNTSADNSFVGFISDEQKETIKSAKETALQNPTKEAYESFLQTIKDNSQGFEEGCFYMIEHQNTGEYKYPSTQNMHMGKTGDNLPFGQSYDDRVIRRVKADAPLLPRLWMFTKDNSGKYRITNANTGCKWANYGSGDLDMPAIPSNQGGLYEIVNIPATNDAFNTKFYIKINDHLMNAFGGDGNDGKVIAAYDKADDAGGFWSFKKVTEIPVAIGAAGWASICMPFPVAIPENVTAYVAESANNNVITLKEVSGTVPAKTPMIITGAASSEAKFTIAQAAEAAEVGTNLFSGTTTERIGFGAEETFALGAKENNAAFMKNNLRKDYLQETENPVYVPANKAYILSSNLSAEAQGAALLSLDFGGATTGIEGVEAEDNKEVIYFDLNGRRVMNPAHGVFVTNTGKKVFIR